MVRTDASGVACCGNCGSHLEVRCTGGCEHPDVVFAANRIASMPKPPGPRHVTPPPRKERAEFCNFPRCAERVVPYSGKGQPPKRCAAHLTKKFAKARV